MFYFLDIQPSFLARKRLKIRKFRQKKAAQGPENTIKVKVIIAKCGPDTSGDDYTRLLPYVLFSGHTALISGPKTAENP